MAKQITNRVNSNSTKVGNRFSKYFNINLNDIIKDTIDNYIIPELLRSLSNGCKNAVDSFFKQEPSPSSDRFGERSYDRYYRSDRNDGNPYSNVGATSKRLIEVRTQQEAQAIRSEMIDLLHEYHEITVAQFIYTVGEIGTTTDHQWGWRSIDGCSVYNNGVNWVVEMPKPRELRRY